MYCKIIDYIGQTRVFYANVAVENLTNGKFQLFDFFRDSVYFGYN